MRKFLLMSSALVVLSGTAEAACIQTPSCSSLGYSSTTACEGGLKCPFGEAWFCNVGGGSSSTPDYSDCKIGHIFYSDKTCSVSLASNKTPIGVVVYTDGQGHGQVISLNDIGYYEWGPEGVDIPTLPNFSSASVASLDLNSCSNSQKIMAYGDKSTYPAAWAANEYNTEGTSAGDWCLPSAGIFSSIYAHKDIVNLGLLNAGGAEIGPSYYYSMHTSTEYSANNVWQGNFEENMGIFDTKDDNRYINKPVARKMRPVLEF